MTSISIVTPWWNHHELIPGYTAAINAAGLGPDDGVVVVDNGSDPPLRFPSYSAVASWRLLRTSANHGFSAPCNHGLRMAHGDAILFLNNDVALVESRWLDSIRDELAPGVLVGAELKAPSHTAVDGRSIPYLDGWCLAGMRDNLFDIGAWDEGFEEPAYFGDNDLCLRARMAGMRLVQVPVGLRHISNVTTRVMDVSGVSGRNYGRYAARARELLGAAA